MGECCREATVTKFNDFLPLGKFEWQFANKNPPLLSHEKSKLHHKILLEPLVRNRVDRLI